MSQKLKFKDRLLLNLIPPLAKVVIKALAFTIRIEVLHEERVRPFWEKDERFILAFWHGRLLMMPFCYHGKRIKLLISENKDGDLLARAMKRFGYDSIRGSTTRGGASAMREMIKAARESDIAITPDGPKGPRYIVQDGVIALARLAGVPIIPVTFGSSKKKVFGSWDSFNLPYPFSRGAFMWGEPIYVSKDDNMEDKRKELEVKL